MLNFKELIKHKSNFYLVKSRERDIDIFVNQSINKKDNQVIKIIRGNRCQTKLSLFQEIGSALQFPYYFTNSESWDGFEECLTDLAWMPAKKYYLFITSFTNVLIDNQSDLQTLFSIFKDVMDTWSKPDSQRRINHKAIFSILLHCEPQQFEECKEKISNLHITNIIGELPKYDEIS